MIKRLTTNDVSLADSIMKHPEVWPYVSDDGATIDGFTCLGSLSMESCHFLMSDDCDGALFIFNVFCHGCFSMHSCVLPGHRGKKAISIAKDCIEWMKNNAGANSFVGFARHEYRNIRLFARLIGFKYSGKLDKAHISNGICDDLDFYCRR